MTSTEREPSSKRPLIIAGFAFAAIIVLLIVLLSTSGITGSSNPSGQPKDDPTTVVIGGDKSGGEDGEDTDVDPPLTKDAPSNDYELPTDEFAYRTMYMTSSESYPTRVYNWIFNNQWDVTVAYVYSEPGTYQVRATGINLATGKEFDPELIHIDVREDTSEGYDTTVYVTNYGSGEYRFKVASPGFTQYAYVSVDGETRSMSIQEVKNYG